MSEPTTKTVSLIAHQSTGEVTALPTDVKVLEGDTIVWELFLAEVGSDAPRRDEKDLHLHVRAKFLPSSFVLKFDPGDGFADVEVLGSNGRGQTTARKQGVYHYEVAIAHDGQVFALLGCPSGTVGHRPN